MLQTFLDFIYSTRLKQTSCLNLLPCNGLWNLPSCIDFTYVRSDTDTVNNQKPLLKIYADADATGRMLQTIERMANLTGFAFICSVATLVYQIFNQISDYIMLTGFACLFFGFIAWITRATVPSYRQELDALPLLYSFYPDGFISHRSGQKIIWDQIKRIDHSKKSMTLHMQKTPNVVQMSFICISERSNDNILRHLKTHAPKRLALNI